MSKPSSAEEVQDFWDIAFVSRNHGFMEKLVPQALGKATIIDADFSRMASKLNWIYEEVEGSPKSILIPFGTDMYLHKVTSLTELETLSFNGRWLPALGFIHSNPLLYTRDFSGLANLTKLKRLDTPMGFYLKDFAFLNALPNLEHLEVDPSSIGRDIESSLGFLAINCPNLKTLTLFERPNKNWLKEISKLPKLEKLTIALKDAPFTSERKVVLLETMQRLIGEHIDLRIVLLDELEPDVPKAFKDHLNRVRKRVREKHISN